MISLVEALNYRCLRYVRQPLGPFHVLVGANASGKSTFLDVIGFLHDLVTEGLEAAVMSRSANFNDLVWQHGDEPVEFAVEAAIPLALRDSVETLPYDTIRYEVAIQLDTSSNQLGIAAERGVLKVRGRAASGLETESPDHWSPRTTLFSPESTENQLGVFRKVRFLRDEDEGNREFDLYQPERPLQRRPPEPIPFRLGRKKSTLANLPEDETSFPVSTWLKQFLREGVQRIELDTRRLQRPSARGHGAGLQPDGSNLPWVIAELERKSPEKHKQWIEHLRTALPDLVNITTIERPEDRHRYVLLVYREGLKVPSWMASDGTLRLLALTLPAYLEGFKGIYLVEEPENGIHPLAIETMFQSLSSVYDSQVLVATHSPIVLGIAELKDVLCFRKDEAGGTNAIAGTGHPELRDWHGEVNLGTLFASGVLG